MWATNIHASAEAMDFSQSLANRRDLPSHANVRSTTHRRGRTSKPLGGIGAFDDVDGPVAEVAHGGFQLRTGPPSAKTTLESSLLGLFSWFIM